MTSKIANLKEEDGKMTFTISSIDVSYVNAIRRTILSDIFIKNIQLNKNLYPPPGTLTTRMDQLLLQGSWRPGAVHVA